MILLCHSRGTAAGYCVMTPVLKHHEHTDRQCGAESSLAQHPPVSQFQIAASLGLGKETHGYI